MCLLLVGANAEANKLGKQVEELTATGKGISLLFRCQNITLALTLCSFDGTTKASPAGIF